MSLIQSIDKPDIYDLTEVLDYTPDSLSPLYEQFNSKNNRGLGFKKTVKQKFDDFEGLGPGFVSIVDDKERGAVTRWSPYMGNEWVDEQNEKLWKAESLMNAPLALAPLVPIVAGTKAISRQRDFSKTGSYKDTKGSRIYPFPEEHTGKTVNMEKIYKKVIDEAFLITDFTTGSLKKNSLFSQNYTSPNIMYSTGVDPYSSNYKPTLKKDLHLYGKQETEFNQVNSFDEGFEAAKASISAFPGKRWPGLDLKVGDEYVKFYQSKGNLKVLPYNKWHQLRRSPFKVPKGIKTNLQKYEGGQLDLLNPNNEIVKYDQGTVNKFIDYTNKELDYQRAVQQLTEKLAKKALTAAGLPYRKNKTKISVDKSHAVPRSQGGSGYTFLEYWRANQLAGATEILDDQVLVDLGIPRNWNEYFIRWHQEQGKGNPATDLGRLSEISWDDYDQASQGADINTIKIRRKTINHFIQRQIEDPTFADQPTLPEEVPPGFENWTNGDQFELLMRESKGFDLYEDVIGSGDIESTFNAKQFDLKWRAETFGEVDQLKSDIQLDKKFKKIKRQSTKQEKLDQSKIRRQTEAQEKKGQQSVTDKLLGPKELRRIKEQLDKDLPD